MSSPQLKLLDRVRNRIRVKGYSIRTEKTYASWIKRFILFHGKRILKKWESRKSKRFNLSEGYLSGVRD